MVRNHEVASSILVSSTIKNKGVVKTPLFMRFFDNSSYTQNSIGTDFGTDL